MRGYPASLGEAGDGRRGIRLLLEGWKPRMPSNWLTPQKQWIAPFGDTGNHTGNVQGRPRASHHAPWPVWIEALWWVVDFDTQRGGVVRRESILRFRYREDYSIEEGMEQVAGSIHDAMQTKMLNSHGKGMCK